MNSDIYDSVGAAIGLGTVHVSSGRTPDAYMLGRGTAIGWGISSCFTLGVGGYISAWLAGVEIRFDGMLLLGLISAAIGGWGAVQRRLLIRCPASGWGGTYPGSAQPGR